MGLGNTVIKSLFQADKLSLTRSGLRSIFKSDTIAGKVLRGSAGFAGYVGGSKLVQSVLGNVAERERSLYGGTGNASAIESFGSVINTLGYIEGTASIFGLSHLQRLRYFTKDISAIGKYGKELTAYNKLSVQERAATKRTLSIGKKFSGMEPMELKNAIGSWQKPRFVNSPKNPAPRRPRGAGSRLSLSLGESAFLGGLATGNAVPYLPYGIMAAAGVTYGSVAGLRGITGIGKFLLGDSAIAGGAAFATGAAGGMTMLKPMVSEGNIVDFSRPSSIDRMNFSTAGLVQAIRNGSRRV